MKKYLFIICISLLCTSLSFAQESGKFRGGIEVGSLYPHTGFIKGSIDVLGAAEIKYNLQKNMNIGFKAETTSFTKHFHHINLKSFSVSYDYYFHSTNKQFSPFIGAGLGYYFCKVSSSFYFSSSHIVMWNSM
jgi:opacity protein-like surface antigen